jgi:hypothetical protein
MRHMAALVAIIAALATPARPAAQPADRVDAELLLDLDLLAEGDPARHRDQSLAERVRMLELLRLLESPAAAAPARGSSTPAARPPAATAPPAEGGTK